jgi:hypothetical protein
MPEILKTFENGWKEELKELSISDDGIFVLNRLKCRSRLVLE